MVWMTGIEPAMGGATIRRLTAWLHPPCFGADRGARTPDPRLKRALLYQLSYVRVLAERAELESDTD